MMNTPAFVACQYGFYLQCQEKWERKKEYFNHHPVELQIRVLRSEWEKAPERGHVNQVAHMVQRISG